MSGGVKCEYQNLSIAIIFLAFTLKNHQRFYKYRERVFDFIEEWINWKNKDKELRNCFVADSKRIFNQLVKKYNADPTDSNDAKIALVCEIIENTDTSCDNLIFQMVLAQKSIIPSHLITALFLDEWWK